MSYAIRTRSASPPPGPAFVHLKVHSAYSLLEGAITVPALAKLAVAHGLPAVAITDTNNLFGALEFSDRLADAGVQPIVGCSLQIDFGDRPQRNGPQRGGINQLRSQPAGALALLAANELGWRNLMKLASRAFFDPADDEPPHLKIGRLEAHSEGLIALTGGPDGPIDMALREAHRE
ncbi:MAG TPA: PHP domain-containing protein, partial [Hyphomicrobiaceae bacterium]|nr:PHP domain-containing protein [Hyphomicrobiaceae bacterium]